jgi:hypothetical protein
MSDLNDNILSWALGIRPKEAKDKRLDADALSAVQAAVKEVVGKLPGIPLVDVVAEVAESVADVLGTRVQDIAASAWNKRKEIVAYADVEKYPPGKPRRVTLYSHPIKWTYRPYVEVTVGKVKLPALDIVVDVTLTFDGAVLVIDGGRIMSISPGKVTLEGVAKVGKFELCRPVKRELGELPVSLPFGEGLPLASEPLARLQPRQAPVQ